MKYQAIIHDSLHNCWRAFSQATEVIATNQVSEVKESLKYIEQKVLDEKLWAVGFLSYEASSAFEPAAAVKEDCLFPKLWFALYEKSEIIDIPKPDYTFYLGAWESEFDQQNYEAAILGIKTHIKRGDTYQVNFSFRQSAHFQGSSYDYFLALLARQSTKYAAFIDTGDFAICSTSPELFFSKSGNTIRAKPMKGSAARSAVADDDQRSAKELQLSQKDRSENVMIVDMIRNDLSRIAKDASVKTTSLFDLERYETIWQLTSSVEAQTESSLSEVFKALFPCASITGAPKSSTMKIISAFERSPRRIYTGSIGFISPQKDAHSQFNVAIRSVLINHKTHQATYGVGSGIVWDSDPKQEYAECLLKAESLAALPNPFELLETMLWTKEESFYFLQEHLSRAADSALFFNFKFDLDKIRTGLLEAEKSWNSSYKKVRLLINSYGEIQIEQQDYSPSKIPLFLGLSKFAVNSENVYLHHKTTNRGIYQQALADCPDCDDVILWNEHGEITETCIGNLAYRLGDSWYTPPLSCGILKGIYRESLLKQGQLEEKVLLLCDINKVNEFAILNSVRLWTPAHLRFHNL